MPVIPICLVENTTVEVLPLCNKFPIVVHQHQILHPETLLLADTEMSDFNNE